MAESFAYNIADQLVGKLASLALQELALASGVKDDLHDLKNTISTIQAVILDAEEQQSKNHQLTDWLGKLKVALDEAEDVVDEFEYDGLSWTVANGRRKQVRNFFSTSNPLAFRFKMGHKIKKIREQMNKIADDKSKFNLTERFVDMHLVRRRREMTHSFAPASDIIGREEDTENIVSILRQSSDYENVSVVPIVGLGGLGKTALAKLVYNDERVVTHFDKSMWVCVSDEFDVEKLTKKILTSATDGSIGGDLSIDQLQTHLRIELNDKRFLLVLDDVWNDDREKWLKLKVLLMGGAPGSKILVTTRKSSVAEVTGTFPTQEMKGLSHEDCLSLFLRCAFKDGQGKQYPNLVKIGNDIVQKCGGVPLAVRSLAGLLYSKVEERDWVSVRDNEIWKLEKKGDGILPALKLSYDELPSHLKRCFAFCSFFPKDHHFDSINLIDCWLARGLIQPSNTNQELEDIGNQYVSELLSISFFQDVEDGKIRFMFKMHDLVHDLALSVAEFGMNEAQDVCFTSDDSRENLKRLKKIKKVGTIYFPYAGEGATGESFLTICTSRCKHIRYLDLSESDFESLPRSIGSLKHLRHLDLRRNKKIKKLPSSICKLYHLLALNLNECSELEELPRNMGNLISLRHLEITTKQKALPGETNGLGCLTSLRHLAIVECRNLEYIFEGLQNLTALRTLLIGKCPSLLSLPPTLKHLPALENLVIGDCERLNLMDVDADDEDKIQGASSRLRLLYIGSLPKLEALPGWLIQGPAATTLHNLVIDDFLNLKALPESLKNLTSIQELHIRDCPELSERCQPETGKDWHKMAHVPNIYLDRKLIKSTTNNK